jgi:hypothetical protein
MRGFWWGEFEFHGAFFGSEDIGAQSQPQKRG